MEKFIKDEGKVRNCIANIEKMNIFEYVYYALLEWGFLQSVFSRLLQSIYSIIKEIGYLLCCILTIITFPINIWIYAYIDIRRNKKWMKKNFKNNY
jgi:hypothetical protein